MRLRLHTMAAIIICFVAGESLAQTGYKMSSLCGLQQSAAQGEHIKVRVSGVYSIGPENSTLDNPACPVVPYQSTWVELLLKSEHNKEKLSKLLAQSGRASVVFEGEFYGPPPPDPKLPEALQKAFPPHWGHLGCCRTKFVIQVIREVAVAPSAVVAEQKNTPVSEKEAASLCGLQEKITEGDQHKQDNQSDETAQQQKAYDQKTDHGKKQDNADK